MNDLQSLMHSQVCSTLPSCLCGAFARVAESFMTPKSDAALMQQATTLVTEWYQGNQETGLLGAVEMEEELDLIARITAFCARYARERETRLREKLATILHDFESPGWPHVYHKGFHASQCPGCTLLAEFRAALSAGAGEK